MFDILPFTLLFIFLLLDFLTLDFSFFLSFFFGLFQSIFLSFFLSFFLSCFFFFFLACLLGSSLSFFFICLFLTFILFLFLYFFSFDHLFFFLFFFLSLLQPVYQYIKLLWCLFLCLSESGFYIKLCCQNNPFHPASLFTKPFHRGQNVTRCQMFGRKSSYAWMYGRG